MSTLKIFKKFIPACLILIGFSFAVPHGLALAEGGGTERENVIKFVPDDSLFKPNPEGPFKMENFNFLEGKWVVYSRSLLERMSTETVWLENTMETEYTILLGGLIALNNTYGTFNNNPMDAVMYRAYDPDKDEWVMHWMSRAYPHLTEQVRGNFKDGVGIFYGTEVNRGRTFKMRFRWVRLAEDHALWDQAYQNPETGEWQTNWVLELTRIKKD